MDEYLVCRAGQRLKAMQKQLGPIATRRARVIMSAVYIVTAAFVLMGTLHYDLTIALSNAVVRWCHCIWIMHLFDLQHYNVHK